MHCRKAQSTAEYAILIAVVIGAVIAMQTYVKRGLQSRTHDGMVATYETMTGDSNWNTISGVTATKVTAGQYEPTEVTSKSTQETLEDKDTVTMDETGKGSRETLSRTQQAIGDYQTYDYTE
jgi:hypothetical protein